MRNNVLYDVNDRESGQEHWYVVRDLGTALGGNRTAAPQRGDPDIFEHEASRRV